MAICVAGYLTWDWSRKTANSENRIIRTIESSGIKGGQVKPFQTQDFSIGMKRKDVTDFMRKNKFYHSGSRRFVDNLRYLEKPKGYVEIFEANAGHPLCPATYIVITYYDEASLFTDAKAAIQSDGCL